MVQKSDDLPALADESPAPEAVATYLRQNPGFLVEHPDLLADLTPPELQRGETVIDMQGFMLNRLRTELADIKAREKTLLAAAQSNSLVQGRINGAVDSLLAARSFKHLIRIINENMPALLKVEVIALCVETADKLPAKGSAAGVVVIEPGTIDALMAGGSDIALLSDTTGDMAVFGTNAARVQSMALLRLGFGSTAPNGLLALGGAKATSFEAGQETDMLAFLGCVVEHCIRRWLSQRA